MGLPRVSFYRFGINFVQDEKGPRAELSDMGTMQGVVLGVLSRPYRDIFYDGSTRMPVGGVDVIKTFAVIGCDDGKVEDVMIERLTYLRD